MGVPGGGRLRGINWDNCNSIINIIYFLKISYDPGTHSGYLSEEYKSTNLKRDVYLYVYYSNIQTKKYRDNLNVYQ